MVGDKPVLMVKRFDREKANSGYYRHRMISGLTLLQESESATDRSRWSYLLLADQLRRLDVREKISRVELFRRAVFNALIHNADDHPRNHAMIADRNGWRLSPAYDLTPTPTVSSHDRSLAMTVGKQGRAATAANLISQAADDAQSIVSAMKELVSNSWYGVCREAGVSVADCEFVASAFDHSGFDVDNILESTTNYSPR